MKDLSEEIEKKIREYYEEEFRSYTFHSSDAEEEVWVKVEDLISDIHDMLIDGDMKIGYSLEDNTRRETNRDMESFIYNCQL